MLREPRRAATDEDGEGQRVPVARPADERERPDHHLQQEDPVHRPSGSRAPATRSRCGARPGAAGAPAGTGGCVGPRGLTAPSATPAAIQRRHRCLHGRQVAVHPPSHEHHHEVGEAEREGPVRVDPDPADGQQPAGVEAALGGEDREPEADQPEQQRALGPLRSRPCRGTGRRSTGARSRRWAGRARRHTTANTVSVSRPMRMRRPLMPASSSTSAVEGGGEPALHDPVDPVGRERVRGPSAGCGRCRR